MRAAQDREQNILRRFKVAPISPAPMLVASMVTGLLTYLPVVLLILSIAGVFYGMPFPERPVSLLALLSLGVVSFRSLGLIIASVVNSLQESHLIIQILYMPMLLLSGATFPLRILPRWAQMLSEFLPASYLVRGLQGIFVRHETLATNWVPASALCITTALSTFISIKLFRWDKTEKLRPSAKLWVLAVLTPFILIGLSRVLIPNP
jgi:ABC-type multidrug transport system permease subunit